ncbi:MAG: hypothetical protein K2P99_04740 [Burkholderiales bacterium]|nr:hypothetical protein [Burkholderiales bacterium]
MNIVKPLKWTHRKSDNVVYVNPIGMRYGYFIKPNEENNNIYELAYVENSGVFKEHGNLFDSVELAKQVAAKHYREQVIANILPEYLK